MNEFSDYSQDNTRVGKPFFYYQRLTAYDKWAIIVYIFLTLGLFYFFRIGGDPRTKQDLILGYAIGTQLLLFFFLYASLRNFASYLIWLSFGLIHLIIYFSTYRISELRNTVLLLLLFQLLRFISLKVQLREFVAPTKGGGKDLFDNRDVAFIDYFIFIIYMASWAALSYL